MTDDYSVIEAMAWRLASEIFRRHPLSLRLGITRPGDGQYEALSLFPRDSEAAEIRITKNGRIHLFGSFHGRRGSVEWEPVEWDEFMRSKTREFVERLETAAGLPAPQSTPSTTKTSLVYRQLAAVVATTVKESRHLYVASGDQSDEFSADPHPALSLDPWRG